MVGLDRRRRTNHPTTTEASQHAGGGVGGSASSTTGEGPDSAHDIILGAVLTRDVGPLLQAINDFCRGCAVPCVLCASSIGQEPPLDIHTSD